MKYVFIDFRKVKRYWCKPCKRWKTVRPCPECEAALAEHRPFQRCAAGGVKDKDMGLDPEVGAAVEDIQSRGFFDDRGEWHPPWDDKTRRQKDQTDDGEAYEVPLQRVMRGRKEPGDV